MATGATARAAAASRVLTLALEGLVPPAARAVNARGRNWAGRSTHPDSQCESC